MLLPTTAADAREFLSAALPLHICYPIKITLGYENLDPMSLSDEQSITAARQIHSYLRASYPNLF